MKVFVRLSLGLSLFLACCLPAGTALAADETVSATHKVDPRVVRVRLEGLVDLTLRQGAVPGLVITGDKDIMARAVTAVEGDTVTIGTEGRVFALARRRLLRAELTLPQLREVASDSVGTADIIGFSGPELDLKLDGAGSMKVQCAYQTISAVLGGVGSLDINGAIAEGVDLNLRGAGVVTLRGSGKWLKADLGGLGNLNAQHFSVDTVNLDLSGLGNATVSARQNVNLNLSGLGSVTVHGKPVNRSVSVNGLGKVSWK